MQIDVSIIIPVYNVENFLEQCIDSALQQKNCNLEIIIIDDCSTDNSFAIAKKYAEKFSQIKLIQQKENKKVGAARNLGIENAKGKYILFIDSDDYLKPNSIYELFQKSKKENLDVLFSTYWKEKNTEISKIDFKFPNSTLTGVEFMDNIKFLDILVWNKLWKRSFLIENQLFFVEHGFEDVIFVAEAMEKAKRVKGGDFPFYYYRIRENSTMTQKVSQTALESHYKMILKLENLYKRNKDSNQFLKLFLYSFVTFDGFINRFEPNSKEEKKLKLDLRNKVRMKYLYYRNSIFKCNKLGVLQKISLYISPKLLRILFELKHK